MLGKKRSTSSALLKTHYSLQLLTTYLSSALLTTYYLLLPAHLSEVLTLLRHHTQVHAPLVSELAEDGDLVRGRDEGRG